MISMAVANEQVPFEQWRGKNIVENIIRTQKCPDPQTLINLANLVPYLKGGLGTIDYILSDAWHKNGATRRYMPDHLIELRDQIIKELEEIQSLGNQI